MHLPPHDLQGWRRRSHTAMLCFCVWVCVPCCTCYALEFLCAICGRSTPVNLTIRNKHAARGTLVTPYSAAHTSPPPPLPPPKAPSIVALTRSVSSEKSKPKPSSPLTSERRSLILTCAHSPATKAHVQPQQHRTASHVLGAQSRARQPPRQRRRHLMHVPSPHTHTQPSTHTYIHCRRPTRPAPRRRRSGRRSCWRSRTPSCRPCWRASG